MPAATAYTACGAPGPEAPRYWYAAKKKRFAGNWKRVSEAVLAGKTNVSVEVEAPTAKDQNHLPSVGNEHDSDQKTARARG